MTTAEILIVDDERPLRELLALLFEDAGYRVRAAIHGRDALAQIEEARPDLIVMDLMMPVMGGLELYRQLKRQAETPRDPDHRHERRTRSTRRAA